MLSPRIPLYGLVIFLLPALALASPSSRAPSPAAPVIAVTDFSGPDKNLGRFIAETLLTDLAQSQRLQLVERTEIRRALTELKLQSTGLAEPQQVQRLGKLVSADHLVVGSYFARDDQIIVNARLLDVRSGRLVPGGAGNVAGDHHDLLSLTHRLARQFHKRLTGQDLELAEDGADSSQTANADLLQPASSVDPPQAANEEPSASAAVAAVAQDDLDVLRQRHIIPAEARPNGVVSERDLAHLVAQVSRQLSSQTDTPVTVSHPQAPVTRIRAMAALVKVVVSPDQVAVYRSDSGTSLPPDADQVPAWGLPYVAAALEQSLWRAERPVRAREPATWAFVCAILIRMPLVDASPPHGRRVEDTAFEAESGAYTGLVIDARDYSIQRAMGPRILDEDGRVLYPDPNHVPDYDFLQDHGMAAYCQSPDNMQRAGGRPLVVRAAGISGGGRDDFVVSNETADRIREAERRGRFLRRWAVCILVDPGN